MAQFPIRAIQQEVKSIYRMQLRRLGDLEFAQIKERLYRREIDWKDISKPSNDKAKIVYDDDIVTLSFEQIGSRRFKRSATVHSIGKQGKQGEEWRLATIRITFEPADGQSSISRRKKFCKTFTYQVLLGKAPQGTANLLPEIKSPQAIETG